MFYRLKKKLLHFSTNGNIAEDFVKARHGKVKRLRKRIRLCFYIHCAAVVLCVAATVILGTLPDIIKAAVCTLISTVFALFAVGDHKFAKVTACVIDTAMAAGAFILSAFAEGRAMYIVCGCLMCVGLASLTALTALSACKRFLLEYSPLSIRRDDYTLLNEVGYKLQTNPQHVAPQREIAESSGYTQPLPPLTSEMRELAGKVRDILLSSEKKAPENMPGKTDEHNDRYSSNSQ